MKNKELAEEKARILNKMLLEIISFILNTQHKYASQIKEGTKPIFTSINHMLSYLSHYEKMEYRLLVNDLINKIEKGMYLDCYGNELYLNRKQINRLINKFLADGQDYKALMNKNSQKENVAGLSLGSYREDVIARMKEILLINPEITTEQLLNILVTDGIMPTKEDGKPCISRQTLQKIREEVGLAKRDLKPVVKKERSINYCIRIDAQHAFESLQADIKYLPISSVETERDIYFIGVIDDYSRFVFGLFTYDQCQQDVNNLFYSIFKEYGLPEDVLLDNNSVYSSDSFKNIFTNLNIDLRYCKVKTSRAKGKIARFNRTLNDFIKTIISPNATLKDYAFVQKANEFLHRYNYETIHSATKEIPAQRLERSLLQHKIRRVDDSILKKVFYQNSRETTSSTEDSSNKDKSVVVQSTFNIQNTKELNNNSLYTEDKENLQLANENTKSEFVELKIAEGVEPYKSNNIQKRKQGFQEESFNKAQDKRITLDNLFNPVDLSKARNLWKKHHKKSYDEIDFLRFYAHQYYDFKTQIRLEVLIALETDRGLPNEILSSLAQQYNIDINTGLDCKS